MTREQFTSKVEHARLRVYEMDLVDGFKNRQIAVIMAALETGVRNPETDAVYDAYAMLEDLLPKIPVDSKPE